MISAETTTGCLTNPFEDTQPLLDSVYVCVRACVRVCVRVCVCVCCLLYTSPSPRDSGISRMPSSA